MYQGIEKLALFGREPGYDLPGLQEIIKQLWRSSRKQPRLPINGDRITSPSPSGLKIVYLEAQDHMYIFLIHNNQNSIPTIIDRIVGETAFSISSLSEILYN